MGRIEREARKRASKYKGLATIVEPQVNAAKLLRLAHERELPVVVRWRGSDGLERQTPPAYVLSVDAAGDGVFARLDRGTRHTVPFRVDCSQVTLVHPRLEEHPEES